MNKVEDRQQVPSFRLEKNPQKLSKLKKTKGQFSVWDNKNLKWFNVIGYTIQNTLYDCKLISVIIYPLANGNINT